MIFTTMMLQAAQVAAHADQAASTILSQGVVGACLVALSIWYILKDRKYEKRIDEMLKREREFQEAQAVATEKYRLAMENVSKTLDVVVNMVKER
jgi:hypothetical protein